MPKYKTHLIGGLATFILLKKSLNLLPMTQTNFSAQETICLLFFCLFGSLFPDIDTKSKIQKIFYIFIFLALFVLLINKNWLLLGLTSLIALIPLLVNHRGIFHKFWFIASIGLAATLIFVNIGNFNSPFLVHSFLFFSFGALSHIMLDYGVFRFIKRKILK